MSNPTRYELQATAPDGTRYLAGYARIPSQAGAIRMLRQHGESWVKLAGTDRFDLSGKGRMGFKINLGRWSVSFTGRTMLEAERAPLPWFKDLL